MFWILLGLSYASVFVWGVGMFCLLRPQRVVAAYQRHWSRSRQIARMPAILDAAEARLWGVMALLLAVILAGSTFIPR